jgi:putative hydrolase of the HAD superfamily
MLEFERDPILNQTIEKLRRLGIEAVEFDLDDTLIFTAEIFRRWMEEYSRVVCLEIGADAVEFGNRLKVINDEEYVTSGVSPTRWLVVTERLFREYDKEQVIRDRVDVLMRIYQTEPRIRPGAKPILSGLRDGGFKLGMVTHANTDWTMRKLYQTGLINYFDAIEIASENGHKTVEHWQRGMGQLEVPCNRCLAVGDNLKGDIIPAMSLGARAIWIPSPWSVYREGEVPKGVVEMKELSGFWDAVQELK